MLRVNLQKKVYTNDFSFDRPRPLMALCAELGNKYGLLINYEDAPFDPVTELKAESHPRTRATIFTPKWHPITFRISPNLPSLADRADFQANDTELDTAQTVAAVQEIVRQYNSSGNPGKFKLLLEGDSLHVEQVARMINGSLRAFEPVSNSVVAWKSSRKSCQLVLNDLFSAMQTQHGVSFAISSVPVGALLTHYCDLDGNSSMMRDILENILAGLQTDPITGTKMSSPDGGYSWQLVYEPNWNKYFLNIQAVRRRNTPAPSEISRPESPTERPASGARLKHQEPPTPVQP